MVIVNDHYQSIGIVCLSLIRGVQRVAHKRSISFNYIIVFVLAALIFYFSVLAKRLAGKNISDMIYLVLSGLLNLNSVSQSYIMHTLLCQSLCGELSVPTNGAHYYDIHYKLVTLLPPSVVTCCVRNFVAHFRKQLIYAGISVLMD